MDRCRCSPAISRRRRARRRCSLHAFFFFMGQAVGPLAYGFALSHFGKFATLMFSAAAILVLGVIAARLLNQKPAEMADI